MWHIMNKTSIILILSVSISGCLNSAKHIDKKFIPRTDSSLSNTENTDTIHRNISFKFFVKDSSQYNPHFIKEIQFWCSEVYKENLISLSLVDNKVTYIYKDGNRNDSIETTTSYLPTNLVLNKIVQFSTKKDNSAYLLNLKRTNNSDVEFEYFINNVTQKKGKAILSPYAYIGMGFESIIGLNGYAESCDTYIDEKHYGRQNKDELNKMEVCVTTEKGNLAEFIFHVVKKSPLLSRR
jgi:hypothetical protein